MVNVINTISIRWEYSFVRNFIYLLIHFYKLWDFPFRKGFWYFEPLTVALYETRKMRSFNKRRKGKSDIQEEGLTAHSPTKHSPSKLGMTK